MRRRQRGSFLSQCTPTVGRREIAAYIPRVKPQRCAYQPTDLLQLTTEYVDTVRASSDAVGYRNGRCWTAFVVRPIIPGMENPLVIHLSDEPRDAVASCSALQLRLRVVSLTAASTGIDSNLRLTMLLAGGYNDTSTTISPTRKPGDAVYVAFQASDGVDLHQLFFWFRYRSHAAFSASQPHKRIQ
jgi:hypothetical protein